MPRSSRPRPASREPTGTTSPETDAVSRIADLTRAIHAYLRARDEAVSAARAAGASWPQIARAAGISHQAAHQRWANRQSGK